MLPTSKSVKLRNDVPKTTAQLNNGEDWGWSSCKWKVSGYECGCYNKNRDRRVRTWPV